MSQPPDRQASSSYSASPPRPPLDPRQRAAQRAARRATVRRRRLIAGGVAVFVLVCVCIAVVIAVTGGDAKPGPNGDGTPSPGTSSGKSPKPTRKPTPTALPTPTTAKPLRFFAGGDSMGGEMGNAVIPLIYDTGKAKTVGWYKVSSGLSRPDFFNWLDYLRKYSYRYQAMTLMMGTNDAQNMTLPSGTILRWGTREWKAEYRKRVGAAMDQMLKSGVLRVYWVGMPVMESVNFNKDMMVINAAFRDEAEKRKPKARYVDIVDLLSTAGGAYDPRWRQSDGVHFNIAGTERLGEYIAGIVEKEWHLTGTTSGSPSP